MHHVCSEDCFCQLFNQELLLEKLEIVPPQDEEAYPQEEYSFDPDLASRMDEWWDMAEEIGGEG